MKKNSKILILSLPRSGSSLLTKLVMSAGYSSVLDPSAKQLAPSNFNKGGYFEEIPFILLNDQIIRMQFGERYSFLNVPSFEWFKEKVKSSKQDDSFHYDIDEESLFIPEDFEEHVEHYTGNTWDVWGITRMKPGGKWHRCYSAHEISDGNGILRKQKAYEQWMKEAEENIVIKDPRLGLTLPFFDFASDVKVLIIKRKPDSVLTSMRRHYGPDLFTENKIKGTDMVSNHFNLKVPSVDFDDYYEGYHKIIDYSVGEREHLTLDYDRLVQGLEWDALDEFVGGKVNRDIIER